MRKEVFVTSLNTIDKVKDFAEVNLKYPCDIDVFDGRYTVDGKSVLGLFSLRILDGVNTTIVYDSEDEVLELLKSWEALGINYDKKGLELDI